MISLEDFFDRVQIQIEGKLPFTVYKKPEEEIIHAILQNDDKLNRIKDYSESGFVFSPFDTDKAKPIIIPLSNAKPVSTFFIKSETHDKSLMDVSEPFHFPLRKVDHNKVVQNALNAIDKNEIVKVVVSRAEKVDMSDKNIMTLLKKLLNTYPGAFVYLWYHPKIGTWMGASPETLLNIEENQFKTMALAGTQPFMDIMEVEWGEKEIEEQQLVVDSIINKLRNEDHDLKVSPRFTVKAGNVLHLRTDISGKIENADFSLQNLVETLHPTPAVCGLPTDKAKEFISKNENYDREFYTGFLGELNIPRFKINEEEEEEGNEEDIKAARKKNKRDKVEEKTEKPNYTNRISNLYVNLRCMKILGAQAIIYVGGGITKSSDLESEWNETVNKTKVMKKVLF